MADQVLAELEAAAQVILAPPNLITGQQRQSAETVFLNFRKTKSPYQLCREILERSSVDYVLFESAGLIKSALIREWVMMQDEDIRSLRQYLLHYIISKPQLAPFVRERILQVIAIMVKRGSVEDLGRDRGQILNEVEGLIMTGDLRRQLLGCSIISALMQEYATTVKSSDVGLAWEVHFKAKKQFEISDLKRIFKFCFGALGELTKEEIQEALLPLIKHLLSIIEGVLVWGYVSPHLPKRLIGVFESAYESDSSPALRLGPMWRDVILDPNVLDLFFTLYWKVRTNPQLAHHARNCLVQLATLNGLVIESGEVETQYLTSYLQSFLKLVSNIDVIDQEAIGISNMVRKVITFFRATLTSLPEDILRSFMEQMTRLTCLFAEGAAQEESMCADDCLYMEAFEHLLEAWIIVLSEAQLFPSEFCKQSSAQIFNTYLSCHLAPPDGNRGAGGKELNDEEIDATEENDRDKFKEQLQTIGNFGRQVPGHSLPLLARLLEDRTNRLSGQLNRMADQSQPMSISSSSLVEALYEDIHWLVLLAGHVLCMDSEGEVALVPSEIMRYSMDQTQQGQVNVETTMRLLASPQNSLSDIDGAEQSADHVIRLISAVFRLCQLEKIAISANLTNMLSPELSSSIVWFLHRWSLSYLLPIESFYSEISTTILQAFGADTPGALWTVSFLLEKIECNINVFKGEPNLIKETMRLLITLVESQVKSDCVLKSGRLCNLVNLATKDRFDLPQAAKRGLMRTLVQIGTAVQDPSSKQQYWAQTLQPLDERFKQLTGSSNFAQTYHQEQIRLGIIDVLESFVGVTQGVQGPVAEGVFERITPVLNELPNLLSLYHNYQEIVQLILELFCECTRRMLCYLPQGDSIRIYEICLRTIQTYARCNTNRTTVENTAEEDTFQDILLLMQLLTNLLTKEIIDCSHTEPAGNPEQNVSPVNVFLFGLNIIMPLMTMDLLKFPSLCLEYFKMITFVCEIHPEKVFDLPVELLSQLLASVELGLFSFGHEITILCCDIIQVLAKHIYTEGRKGRPKNQLMAPFMNLLMNLILSRQINSDLISSTSIPLYYLICCYQEQYQQLVQSFLAAQTDPRIAERLTAAFVQLTACIELDTERPQRLRFRDNFDKFIVNVQGFLMVK
nr:exportin-4-like isoform X1 [Neodiprion pinetum]